MIDERDFSELSDVEKSAVGNVKSDFMPRKRTDEVWNKIRKDKDKYKVWKREKDKIEFRIAKQKLRVAYQDEVKRILNTPYYDLPWYERIFMAPFVLGLKVINWVLRKLTEVTE